MARTTVFLLRTPDSEKPDRYESALSQAGYDPVSVAALETGFVNENDLRALVQSSAFAYDGVIITSFRASNAWKRATQVLSDFAPSFQCDWSMTPFYAVGRATARTLRDVPDTPATPRDVRGEESGTGEQLARFIVEDAGTDIERKRPPHFLYLTGDKNRDTVPHILAEAGISFEPLQVYGTSGIPDFAQKLRSAMDALPADTTHCWVVFFAPSSTDFALPYLKEHFDFRHSASSVRVTARIAAIGPVSSDHISCEHHLCVDAVALNPNPADLVTAMNKATK
ncbi:tetrapyrrole biosynthesis, uroporphyrinogen III synthase [Schizophyllum fasciatum]